MGADGDETNAASDGEMFGRFARWCEQQLGRPGAFAIATAAILIWVVTGPLFGWSDGWQLLVNTATSVVTFLMVFVIQHTQRRDTRAIQLKLDELIRVNRTARNDLIQLEQKTETEVAEVSSAFTDLDGA